MNTLLFAFIVTTNALGNIVLTAEDNMAICQTNSSGPTLTRTVYLAKRLSHLAFKDCEYGDPMNVTRYSVRAIIGELKKIGKFAAFRSFLESANYDWDFIGSNYLASDDPDFKTMIAAVVDRGILTQAELDELLPKCIWEQTPMN